MNEINILVKYLESQKIFYSPLADHFSPVMQSFQNII